MPAGEHLEAVETSIETATRSRTVSAHDTNDIMLVHLFREAAMQRLADRRRRDRGEPVRRIGLTAPNEVRDLHHQSSAVPMDALRELQQMWDDLVGTDIQLTKDIRRIHIHI